MSLTAGALRYRYRNNKTMNEPPQTGPDGLPVIYADFNGYGRGEDTDWVELDTFGTLKDLHFFQVVLCEGLELMAWDQSDDAEDMEVTGRCRYHSGHRPHWCVHFPKGTLCYVPQRHEFTRDFICFRCRRVLPDSVRHPENGHCPGCDLSIEYPWAAPTAP